MILQPKTNSIFLEKNTFFQIYTEEVPTKLCWKDRRSTKRLSVPYVWKINNSKFTEIAARRSNSGVFQSVQCHNVSIYSSSSSSSSSPRLLHFHSTSWISPRMSMCLKRFCLEGGGLLWEIELISLPIKPAATQSHLPSWSWLLKINCFEKAQDSWVLEIFQHNFWR